MHAATPQPPPPPPPAAPSGYVVALEDFTPSNSGSCCRSRRRGDQYRELDWDAIYHLVMQLELGEREKSMILVRFRRVFLYVANNYSDVGCYYNKSKLFVITVGIVNPSLLSITTSRADTIYTVLFWTVWTLQLLTSLITAYVNFNKWDKRYFLYMAFKHRIEQEIWTYLELTGRYGIVNPTSEEELRRGQPTHGTKLHRFLLQIETIYRRLRDNDVDIESADYESNEGGGDVRAAQNPSEANTDGLMSSDEARKHIFEDKIADLQRQIDERAGGGGGGGGGSGGGGGGAGDDIDDIDDIESLRQKIHQYERMEQQNSWRESQGRLLKSGGGLPPVESSPESSGGLPPVESSPESSSGATDT